MPDSFSFAIIGTGFMGHTHLRAIREIPNAKIAVVCSRTQETGLALADSCGADWTSDYKEAIARDDVDIVSICTPSGFHLEPAEYAAKQKKHIVIEKPMEVTLKRADRIIHAADAAGVKLTCIFPYRFHVGVKEAKNAIAEGRLGRLTTVGCYVNWYRAANYYSESWHGTWKLDGGGALMNQSIHNVDLLQYLAGPVRSITGRCTTLAHDIEVEDIATALLTFENGATGVIQATTGSWPGDSARLEFHGDQGTIALTEGRITEWKLQESVSGEEEHMLSLEEAVSSGAGAATDYKTYEMHRRQIRDLLDAVRHDRSPIIDGHEGRKAIEIILAVYLSSDEGGCAVNLPLPE